MSAMHLSKGMRLPTIPVSKERLLVAEYASELIRQIKARGSVGLLYKHCYSGILTNVERDELAICQRIAKQAVINRTK